MQRATFLAVSACMALGLTLISAPAQAGPILDPVIGIRGGEGSREAKSITTGSAIELQGCGGFDTFLSSKFFCAAYEFTGLEGFGPLITSLNLAFWSEDGAPIPTEVCNEEKKEGCFSPSQESQFKGLTLVDPFVVQLSARPGEWDCYPFCSDPPIFPGQLLLFIENTFDFTGGFISVQAVNGLSDFQKDVAAPGKPLEGEGVPEPATLALLGTGMFGAALRERHRRRRDARIV